MIPENYTENAWVYLLITSNALVTSPKDPRRLDIPAAHPVSPFPIMSLVAKLLTNHPTLQIHLHGHDFALLQQSSTPYNQTQTKLLLKNPPRRDVTLLPKGGFIVIAFKADNPGIWLLHCHIAVHASSGLAMQILERQDAARKLMTPAKLSENTRVCRNWKKWFANPKNYWHPEGGVIGFQDDSGI